MRYRPLGRTGLELSELALNTRGLDARAVRDLNLDEARAAFALALAEGVNAIAASPAHGEAQAIVAAILKAEGRAHDVHILAEVAPLLPHDLPSPHLHANHVFPGHHIRASVDAALKALGVERLAVLRLPAWQAEWSAEGDWRETCRALKTQGKIAAFGVAPFDHDPGAALDIVRGGDIDCIEVMYNPFDPQAAAEVFPLCLATGVGVIVRAPLYAGAITPRWGETPFAPGDWRAAFFYPEHLAETRDRAAALAALVTPPDESVTDLALRFALSQPAVSTVVVGMRGRPHVRANLRAAACGPLPPEVLASLAAHKWLC